MESALKQRLVGASVIIALAVIFIPMMFDDVTNNQNQIITIEIPEEPTDLQQKIIAIDIKAEENSESTKNNTFQNTHEIVLDSPVIETNETILDVVDNSDNINNETNIGLPIEENDPAEVEVISEKKTTKPTVKNEAKLTYRIKYGVFSQQKNAQQLKAKIIHKGLHAIVEKEPATGMYKVYSKYNYTEIDANARLAKVSTLNLNIGNASLESMSKKATDEAHLLLDTGWIVQIGIFSSRENSLKLRNKIRTKGFVSFVDEIYNAKKQKLYRVRIGPFAERNEANTAKSNLQLKMNLKGIIKPHEKNKVVK